MAASDWNWRLATELQDYPWDCAAASTAWALRTIGREYTEQDVIVGLGPARISPTYGLLDASGAGLVEWLGSIGVAADHNPDATWQNMIDAAGFQPMVMGGRQWCHWSGVRMAGPCADRPDAGVLLLANPSPGWMGIYQYMEAPDLELLGAFSAVWFTSW